MAELPFESNPVDLADSANSSSSDVLQAYVWKPPAAGQPDSKQVPHVAAEQPAQSENAPARPRFTSPFGVPEKPSATPPITETPVEKPIGKPVDKLVDAPSQPAGKPRDNTGAVDRISESASASPVPREALDSNARALQALSQVREGQALSSEVRQRFENALRDASSINAARAAEYEQKITEELQSQTRTVSGGKVLPPWTEQKEQEFRGHISATQQAFQGIPEASRNNVAAIEARLKATPVSEIGLRLQLQGQLRAESTPQNDPSGKVAGYLLKKQQLETFTQNNTDGLVRRNLHQQEMAALHSKAIVSGLYAMALDKSGHPEDRAKTITLIRDAIADKFAVSNLPEILRLKEKYAIIEREPIDDKVPGRIALKRALEIMQDESQGNSKERLEKASPFFEQAIGASDRIDIAATDDALKKIAKEAAELGEGGDPKRMEELDKQAVELLENIKQPGLARLAYAMALNNVAVAGPGAPDKELNDRAIGYLRSILQRDPGSKFDPIVQGALKLALENPPGSIREDLALEAGKPEVERLKREAKEQGKPEEELFWRNALGTVADFAVGMAGWYAISRLWRAGKEGPYRNWQTARRINAVEVEAIPSLKPGEKPRLVIRDAEGKEREVTGVRKEDGSFRVNDGEKTELVKMRRGEKLVLKVAPDSRLSPEQAREAAGRVLTPTRTEEAVKDAKSQLETQLRQRDLELEQMRKALEVARAAAGLPAADSARPRTGDSVTLRGETYQVAGEKGTDTVLHRPGNADAAVAEPITDAELKSKYEELKVRIDGKEEIRYVEKVHPERGVYRVSNAAGSNFIAADASLTLVSAEQMRTTTPPPAATSPVEGAADRGGTGLLPGKPVADRSAPERGPAPTADRLQGTDLVVANDGTVRRETVRVGELLSLDRLKDQKELSTEQLRTLESEVERLKKSDKLEEKQKGAELEQTVRALKGEFGAEARGAAHTGIVENAKRELETRGSGRGLAVSGAIGAAILVSAAIGWYLYQQRQPQSPLNRARVSEK